MSVPYQTIRLERSGTIAHLILQRPERLNAIDRRMLDELQDVLDAVERDNELRVLVVKGAGGNFSSGFDLKEQMEHGPAVWTLGAKFSTRTFLPSCVFGISRSQPLQPWRVTAWRAAASLHCRAI
jgi:enoyl-CoA hydratase/carnithine racemase